MPLSADESALVTSLRTGEESAYERLVREYGPRMLAVARRYLHEESDAQDALQDAFVSVFRAIGQFHGQSGLGTWLHSIVVRAALMKLRTFRSREQTSIDEHLPRFEGNFDHRLTIRPPWKRPCADAAASAEVRQLVRQGIDRLPEIYRVVVLLRDIEGMNTQETAQALGLSQAVIKTRLHRARQALREILDPRLSED